MLLVRPLTNSELNSPFFMPLGLLSIGALLDAAGHEVEILDYELLYRGGKHRVTEDYLEKFCAPIAARKPLVAGFTVLADTLPLALLMCERLKETAPGIVTVLGGPGVFGLPLDRLSARFPRAADYICRAEGEESLLELVDLLASGAERPVIKGMIGLTGGRVLDFGPREFSALDDLPPPAYHLVPLEEYVAMASPRIFDVYAGTGCTYACKFCTTAPFWDRIFRAKSPRRLLSELDWLHERLGITRFNLLHDNLANNKAYLRELAGYFEANNTRYEWGCAVRPDSLSRKELFQLRAAGCTMMFCGTDSGSAKILRSMAKAAGTKRFYESFLNCRDAGIALETNTIIGYPDEGDSDFEDTLNIVFDCVAYGSTSSDVSILQPLPGADVTVSNLDSLVAVKTPLLGNFLPREVLALVRSDLKMFPGFGFIRKNNRDYEFYCSSVKLVRYFTRHFFRTIFYLHSACGVGYIELFEWMAAEADPAKFRDRLRAFLSGPRVPEGSRALCVEVFEYEDIIERLRGTDIGMELTNVYSEPDSAEPDRRYVLFEAHYEVPEIFARLPELDSTRLAPKRVAYLLFLDERRGIVTLRLAGWQKRLWTEASRLAPAASTVKLKNSLRSSMRLGGSTSDPEIEEALGRALTVFQQALGAETPRGAALGRVLGERAGADDHEATSARSH